MVLSSGRLVTSIISPCVGNGAPDCWKTKLMISSLPCTWTYYTRHQAPRAQRHIWTVFPKNFVYVLRTTTTRHMLPHGKLHWFLSPFSSKFSDLNFSSYVLYIYLVLCHMSHKVSLGYLCPEKERKLELPLLNMQFDLIMSLARSRTCWCWAKRWSWLLLSCCGVCGAL